VRVAAPILVIDDDAAVLETVADILSDEGYTVVRARNGAEGLAALERTRPRLVILNRWMPVLDGEGFWQALQERGLQIPIIAMTAAHDAERWARAIGAVGVLSKPFKLPVMLDVVAQAVRHS
jgi:DNA-binding NtrC family response regulator